MNTHTPGPWDFSRGGLEISANRLADHIARTLGGDTDAEVAANFNLLEAAPELLAAVESLFDTAQALQLHVPWHLTKLRDETSASLVKARDAIRRAKHE